MKSVMGIQMKNILPVTFKILFTAVVGAAPAIAEPQGAPPASYSTAAELIASVGVKPEGASQLSKARQVARAGNDRVSIDVLKRTKPEEGPVVHETVTEVYQILQGGGTLETGGTLTEPKPMLTPDGKPVNPESIGPSRVGTGLTGGQTRHVAVGDVVMIAPGTPHRFTELDGEIIYAVTRFNPDWYRNHK